MRPLSLAFIVSCLFFSANVWAVPPESKQLSGFEASYEAARAEAAQAFEAAQSFDVERVFSQLDMSAQTPQNKLKSAELREHAKEMAALKTPVKGKLLPVGTVKVARYALDAQYQAKVLKMADQLSANRDKAIATRLRLLKEGPAPGSDHPGATPAGRPTSEAQTRMEDRHKASAANSQTTGRNAKVIGNLLNQEYKKPGDLPAGRGAVATGVHGSKTSAAGEETSGHKPKYAGKVSGKVPELVPKQPPKEAKGWWSKTKEVLNSKIPILKEGSAAFKKHYADPLMNYAENLTQSGAKDIEKGGVLNYVKAAGKSTLAFGTKLAALDPDTVSTVAIGAAVITVGVLAAPVVAGAATAGALVTGLGLVSAGLTGATVYGVTSGVAKSIHKPTALNIGVTALYLTPIPALHHLSKAAVSLTQRVTGHAVSASVATGEALAVAGVESAAIVGTRAAAVTAERAVVHSVDDVLAHTVAHVAKKPIVYGTKYGLAADDPNHVGVAEPVVVAKVPKNDL